MGFFPARDCEYLGPMSNAMSCHGYSALDEYDDERGDFNGWIAGIRDGIGFHADTALGQREAFHEAVEDYLETCAKIGKEPRAEPTQAR